METARKRILDFMDSQGIKPKEFMERTGLKKGFTDRSHQNSTASDGNLSQFLEGYPMVDAYWLITGKGQMLRKEDSENQPSGEGWKAAYEAVKETNQTLNKQIAHLERLLFHASPELAPATAKHEVSA